MKNRSKKFFTADEAQAITTAIKNAERHTAGEIVVMLVDESDPRHEAAIIGGIFVSAAAAILCSFIINLAIHHMTAWTSTSSIMAQLFSDHLWNISVWSVIPIIPLFFYPARYLFYRFPKLKLLLVPKSRIREAVRERAVQAFYEKGLYRTRYATGVLILISIIEQHVFILGDKGINERISPSFWKQRADALAQGIKKSQRGDAVCRAINACGDELAKHFPAEAREKNELPDDVIA